MRRTIIQAIMPMLPPLLGLCLTLSGGGATAQTVTSVSLTTNDITYDPGTNKIYASVPSSAGGIGNSVTTISPATGAVGPSVFVGSEPDKLALSGDGQYLYVALDGADAVRRFDMATQTPSLQFGLGSGSLGAYHVGDMQVLPGVPNAVAVARNYQGISPSNDGVAIYDGGVPRPDTVSRGLLIYDSIAFSDTAARLYAANNEDSGFEFARLNVSAGGVTLNDDTGYLFPQYGVRIKYQAGKVYATNGSVADPETGQLLGRLPLGPLTGYPSQQPFAVLPDAPSNRVYLLIGAYYSGVSAVTIAAYDATTFLPLGSLVVPNAIQPFDINGRVGGLIKCGADAVAFRNSEGQVFIVHGLAFPGLSGLTVSRAALPGGGTATGTVTLSTPAPPGGVTVGLSSSSGWIGVPSSLTIPAGATGGTFTVTGSSPTGGQSVGVTITASYGAQAATATVTALDPAADPLFPANMRAVSLTANDLISDPFSAHLYASVPSTVLGRGNGITAIDPVSATLGASVGIGSEPDALAVSDDGQFLYAGLDGAASVGRLTLADLTPDLQFGLGNSGFTGPNFPGRLVVLPGTPHALAVSRRNSGFSPSYAGTAVYDDGVQRPNALSVFSAGQAIAPGATAARLYEFDEYGHLDRLALDATGISILDSRAGVLASSDIKYDSGLLYSSSGQVADPEAGALLGTYTGLSVSTFLPDSADGRVYFLGSTGSGGSLLLRAYDPNRFLPLYDFALPGISSAASLVRWGPNQLAFRANGNQVVLINAAPPALASLSLATPSVPGGQPTSLTVALTNVGTVGGVPVSITSSDPSVQVGGSPVRVPSGSSQGTFPVTTRAVPVPTLVTLTAAYGGLTRTASLTVTPPSVSGTVTLQGWQGTGEPTPQLTFTLTPSGATAPTVTTTLTPTATASAGQFTFTLTGVAPGAYTLGVKGPLWLREDVPGGVNTTGGSVTGASVTLPAGDATGNNVVDSADLGVLRNAYNTVLGGAHFSAAADFNGDGVVDSADLGLLRNAYNTVGKPF